MRLNELLTNIKNDVPIVLRIDGWNFMGTKSFVCLSEEYTKGKKSYGNAIVTNVGIEFNKVTGEHILIEAETAIGRWRKKEWVK